MSGLHGSVALGLGLSLLVAPTALAAPRHATGQSYVFLNLNEQVIDGRFELTFSDLNAALGLAFRTDGTVTMDEVALHIETIRAYLLQRVAFSWQDLRREIRFLEYSTLSTSFAQFVSIGFTIGSFPEMPQYLDVSYDAIFDVNTEHRGILVVENSWKQGTYNNDLLIALIFSGSDTKQRLDMSDASIWRGFVGLVSLGTHHIWIGIDHILFLLALLIPAVLVRQERRWVPVESFRSALINVVKIVTLFTIAHSVTLSLAALDIIQLPSRLVESVIAVSIAAAALNIVIPVFKAHVLWVVFGFGLFHGFGFASVLSTMGIPGRYMALSLFGFNVGVELGQIAITCLIFPALFFARRIRYYTPVFVNISAALLIFVSLYWFAERAFDIDIPLLDIVWWAVGVDRVG